MMGALLVFLGGGLGSLCRYAVGLWLGHIGPFPLGTFVANALSCLLMGLLVALASRQILILEYRLLLITGFCGGFSTFSTFTNELMQLLKEGQWLLAGSYITISLLTGLVCLYGGFRLVQLPD